MTETFLDGLFEEVITTIALGAGISVIGYFRSIRNKQIQNHNAIEDLCKKTWRIQKAVGLMAMLVSQQTKNAHPEADTTDLENIVKEIMSDK